MEIERKFIVENVDFPLDNYEKLNIKQAYINENPAIRLRKQNEGYYLTVKSKGFLAVEELEIPIDKDTFDKLMKKTEGNIISKTRYRIPIHQGYVAELDIFDALFSPLVTVEVEFPSIEAAAAFVPPKWFSKEVTQDYRYKNSYLAFNGLSFPKS